MKKHIQKHVSKLKTRAKGLSTQSRVIVFVLVFGVIGAITLLISNAATPTAQFEAESASLTTNASVVSDGTASAGSAVLFNAPIVTPPNSDKLSWAPPSGWQNYPVKNASVSVNTQTLDGGGGDMWVKLPNTPTGPITIRNCRNAVVMGGHINLPPNSGPGTDMRGIYVDGCTGVVHIEGVYINGDIPTAEGDGVAIKAPQATVQIENVRINKLYGGFETAYHNHSDIIQPWGGVATLRVDRLTGTSNYQGYQIYGDTAAVGTVIIKNTNIGDSGVPPPDSKGGFYVWPRCGAGTNYTFTNNYVNPRSGRSFSSSLWEGGCTLQFSGDLATYSGVGITGTFTKGLPPGGDFVPAGSVGIGYTSPGYQ